VSPTTAELQAAEDCARRPDGSIDALLFGAALAADLGAPKKFERNSVVVADNDPLWRDPIFCALAGQVTK